MDKLWDNDNVSVPNYARESARIWQTCLVAAMFYLFLLPVWCGRIGMTTRKKQSSSIQQKKKATTWSFPPPPLQDNNDENVQDLPLNRVLTLCGGILGLTCLVLTIWDLSLNFNAYNYYAPRRVFALPMLTPHECRALVHMAHHAAQTNFQTYLQSPERQQQQQQQRGGVVSELIQEPIGWRKEGAPAAHLHLERDPFTAANRTWLGEVLDRRLAPTLTRLYGLAPSSTTIVANDLYLVRYDAVRGAAFLPYHVDGGDVTFSILLYAEDDEEEDEEEGEHIGGALPSGGGTRFWNRRTRQPFAHVKPAVGTLLVHAANIPHEEIAISAGTRVMLIGNLQTQPAADDYNLLATWGNLAWLLARCKYQVDLPGIPTEWHKWFHDVLAPWLEATGDALAPHQVETIVVPEKAANFLQALDAASVSTAQTKWWREEVSDKKPASTTSTTDKTTTTTGKEEL